jgi:hypothetical protein
MNSFTRARQFRVLMRGIYFCMVTAPALLLFGMFICMSFNNSISGTFLEEARHTVENTPPGKVRACATPTEQDKSSPPRLERYVCNNTLVDESIWQKENDRIIRGWYLIAVFISLGIWTFFNFKELPAPLMKRFWSKKNES